MNKPTPVMDAYTVKVKEIKSLLQQGCTYPQINRILAFGNDTSLRQWLGKHPKLDDMRKTNGKRRMLMQEWNKNKILPTK